MVIVRIGVCVFSGDWMACHIKVLQYEDKQQKSLLYICCGVYHNMHAFFLINAQILCQLIKICYLFRTTTAVQCKSTKL